MAPVVPKWVYTKWNVDEFDPGDGLPIVVNTGTYITDQDAMDAIYAAAVLSGITLTAKTTGPTGPTGPGTQHPYIRYDRPMQITDQQRLQALDTLGITDVMNLPPDGTPAGRMALVDADGGIDWSVDPSSTYGSIDSSGILKQRTGTRAGVVLIFDDGLPDQYTIAAPAIEAVGGRANFAIIGNKIDVTGYMSTAQILDLHERGHEIVAHSETHVDLTSVSAADRQAEWDSPKAALEAIVGAGNVTSWVYPHNATNATVDAEAYTRYDRLLGVETWAVTQRIGDRSGEQFARARIAWQGDAADPGYNHPSVLEMVRRTARRDEILIVFTHSVNGDKFGSGTPGIDADQLTEFLTLVQSLGIPMLRADEALPAWRPFPNADFATGDLSGYLKQGTDGTGTSLSVVADATAPPGMTTGHSAQVVANANGNYGFRLAQDYVVTRPGELHVVSVWCAYDKTSGASGVTLAIDERDVYGNTVNTIYAPGIFTAGTVDWTQILAAFTPQQQTRTFGVRFIVGYLGGDWIGTARFRFPFMGYYRYGGWGATMPTLPSNPPPYSGQSTKTGNYTVTAADAETIINYAGTVNGTITVPSDTTAAVAVGSQIKVIQAGAGQVGIAADSGVTLSGSKGYYSRTGGSVLTLLKTAANTWVVEGDATTVAIVSPFLRAVATSGLINSAVTSGSVSLPGNPGDLLVAIVGVKINTDTIATPTGWTALPNTPKDATGTGSEERLYVFTRVCDGTEGATLSFTKTGAAANWRILAMAVQTTAGLGVNAVTSSSAGGGDTTAVIPSLTPAVNLSTVYAVLATGSTVTLTIPTGWSLAYSDTSGSGNDLFILQYTPAGTSAIGSTNVPLSVQSKWCVAALVAQHV